MNIDRQDIITQNPILTVCQGAGLQFKRNGGEFYATCPFHQDGKRPNFRVNPTKQTWYCDVCGMGGSVIDFVMQKDGLDAIEAMKKLSGSNVGPSDKQVELCAYDYTDAQGKLLYQVVRFVPKTFRQRRKGADGSWVWNMEGVTRVLYRLPELVPAEDVILVEGEKDADNLRALGFIATTNVGGAGKWLDSYTESLSGKAVIIWSDNDDAGKKHAETVVKALTGKARKLYRFEVEDKDASDFIQRIGKENAAKAIADKLRTLNPIAPDVPILSMAEMETAYREFVNKSQDQILHLNEWLPSLNKVRPLVPGELAVIMADTGVGKSAILQNLALHAWPMPTLLFELELPSTLMFERFMQVDGKMDARDVWTSYKVGQGQDWRTRNRLSHIFTCDKSRLNVLEMERIINLADAKMDRRPVLVMVDYIGLIEGRGGSRYERVSDVAESMKVLAKATNTIVIIASQVHRKSFENKGAKVQLHDAKDSGSIECSAGLVLGCWREEDGDLMKIKVLKNTKGKAGQTVECNFDGVTMRITERAKEPRDQKHYNPSDE